ncbi:hypothetical protein HanIR_Chr12g0577421 [Helianthus annuus]|nr:hypothetical protein HanIR_Chr12g0577421 [Helianthus annuus]
MNVGTYVEVYLCTYEDTYDSMYICEGVGMYVRMQMCIYVYMEDMYEYMHACRDV